MTLRWRIAAALGVLSAAVAALASVGAYLATAHQIAAQLDADLVTRVLDVGRGPEGNRRGVEEAGSCPPAAVFGPVDAAQLTTPDGAVVVCLASGPALPAATGSLPSGGSALGEATLDGVRYRIASSPFHGGGTLQLARSTADNERVLAALRTQLLVLALGAALAGGACGWLVAARLVAPVERVRRAARSIARTQDLTIAIPVDGPAELRDLATDLSTMVDALATSRQQQRRLVADASHELRTPLTSLTTNLDLLDRLTELPEEERPDVIATLRLDVEELTQLVRDLVDLATDRSTEEDPIEANLAELVGPVVERSRRRSGRTIEVLADPDAAAASLALRPQMIQRAVANLLDNAVKYAPTGPIDVRVGADRVEVLDRGPGVAQDDTERVFERFWRSDTARALPGSGLGLAIVADIAQLHHGTAWAQPRAGGGSVFGFQVGPPQPA